MFAQNVQILLVISSVILLLQDVHGMIQRTREVDFDDYDRILSFVSTPAISQPRPEVSFEDFMHDIDAFFKNFKSEIIADYRSEDLNALLSITDMATKLDEDNVWLPAGLVFDDEDVWLSIDNAQIAKNSPFARSCHNDLGMAAAWPPFYLYGARGIVSSHGVPQRSAEFWISQIGPGVDFAMTVDKFEVRNGNCAFHPFNRNPTFRSLSLIRNGIYYQLTWTEENATRPFLCVSKSLMFGSEKVVDVRRIPKGDLNKLIVLAKDHQKGFSRDIIVERDKMPVLSYKSDPQRKTGWFFGIF